MGDTNYFSGIVKILETPKQRFVKKGTAVTTFRVEVPQNRQNKMISVMFWGNLGREVKDFYKPNDYILVEGYLSLRTKTNVKFENRRPKQVTLTVLKVYPILLNPNRMTSTK